MFPPRVAGAFLVCFLSVFLSFANSQTYSITDLGVLPGDTASASVGINSYGQVVGCSDTSTTYYPCTGSYTGHAFLWDSKNGIQDVGALPGDDISAAWGINDVGEIVGNSTRNSQAGWHAFTWTKKNGIVALRTLPGGSSNFAGSINNAGLIAGASDFKNSNGNSHAVLWTPDRKIHDLGTLAASSTAIGINSRNVVFGEAYPTKSAPFALVWTKKEGMKALPPLIRGYASFSAAINNSGVVVGNAVVSSGDHHPVLWNSKKQIRDLGTLAGGYGTAFGINDLNQVVGYSATASGDRHAFIWTSKKGIRDLNDFIPPNSSWVLVWARKVDNKGLITGWGTINSENHAYLLKPAN